MGSGEVPTSVPHTRALPTFHLLAHVCTRMQALLPVLPRVTPQEDEMEDCRWFHRYDCDPVYVHMLSLCWLVDPLRARGDAARSCTRCTAHVIIIYRITVYHIIIINAPCSAAGTGLHRLY